MNITWYGQTCFRISTQRNKNSSVSILIDPFSKETGLRAPKIEADVLLFSRPGDMKIISGERFLVTGPGEYDVKGVYIEGIPAQTEATIYTIEAEGMKICHLGKLSQKELTSDQLDKIGNIDILMIPVGGAYTIDAGGAVKIMAQIEPKITIPMHYQIPKLKIHPVKSDKVGAKQFNGVKLGGVDKFLKALGIKKLEPLPKLSIKKKDISSEEAKIIVLKP